MLPANMGSKRAAALFFPYMEVKVRALYRHPSSVRDDDHCC